MTWRGGGHPDELISASLAGDLTDAERAELDAHLARCERCRATLAAFKSERRILSGLPMAGPPGDLPARVRSGIEAGRFGAPWWRRPGSAVPLLASAATFAAVVLGVVYFGKLQLGPVGQASPSPESSSSAVSSGSATGSVAPSTRPTLPPAFLGSGELGYLSLTGGSLQPSHLTFVNDASGASIDAGIVSGPPIAASLSPDGQWLAYITQKGETGANEIWVLSLASGHRTLAGCSLEIPFGHQLSWSPHGDLLAFTVSAIDLGAAGGCPQPTDPDGTTRAWLFSVADLRAAPLMEAGPNSYAASFVPFAVPDAPNRLWISHAAEAPSSELLVIAWPAASTESLAKADGVFLPILSPDGNRALFWRGTMTSSAGGWQFSRGGMPQMSDDFRSAGPAAPWAGTPLFTDLTPVGGEAFSSGSYTWGPDSDVIAFWDGAWTGAPQSADGLYPSDREIYVGRVSGSLLTRGSVVDRIVAPESAFVVDVSFSADGTEAAATIGLPSAGIGDPPSANLEILPLAGLPLPSGAVRTIGGGVQPPPWDGPAVYGR